MFFISDFSAHFDIWNNLEKKFFHWLTKNRRGDPYDFDAKCTKIHMVPPTILKIFEKNFFFDFIPIIKMYAPGDKKYAFEKLISHPGVP